MEITSAEFVISNTDVKKCPAGIFPDPRKDNANQPLSY